MILHKLRWRGIGMPFARETTIDFDTLPSGLVAFVGSKGTGKSLPVSAGVLTPSGMKRMGDVRIGDTVCRPYGGFARVVGIFDQGMLPIFEIRLRNGLRARCSADHLWKARPQWEGRDGAWSIVETHHLDETWQLPRSGAVDFLPHDVPLDPYLLGVCLGDGWLGTGAVQFTFGDGKEAIVQEFNRRATSLGVELREQRASGIHRRYGVIASERRRTPNALVRALRALGLSGHAAGGKFIPPVYLYNSREVRRDVLRGLMDTDGSPQASGVDYVSASVRLAEGAQILARSLGGHASPIAVKTVAGYPQPYFRVHLSTPDVPFLLPNKAGKYRHRASEAMGIASIEPAGVEECRCIKLDSEDGLFLTDDFLVTHNTHAMELSGPGTLFRALPYFGESLRDHVIPGVRDAFSELTFEMAAARYTALVQCDPEYGGRGKTEAYLTCDGRAVAGPNLTDFDEALHAILPDEDLFLASVFAAQGGAGSFFQMVRGDRKALFIQMLGLAHLTTLSVAAGVHAAAETTALQTVRANLAAARTRQEIRTRLLAQLDEMTPRRDELRRLAVAAGERLQAAETEYAARQTELTRLDAEQEALKTERATRAAAVTAAEEELARLDGRLADNTQLLADAEHVRGAAAEISTVTRRREEMLRAEHALTEQLRPLETTQATRDAEVVALLAEYERLKGDRDAAQAAVFRVQANDAPARLEVSRTYLTDLEQRLTAARATQAQLAAAIAAEDERTGRRDVLAARHQALAPRTGLLAQIDATHPMCSVCPLTQDAIAAQATLGAIEQEQDALGPPGDDRRPEHRTLQQQIDADEAAAAVLRRSIQADQAKTVTLGADQALAAVLPDRDAALAACVTKGKATKDDRDRTRSMVRTTRELLDETVGKRQGFEDRIRALQADADKLPAIAAAEVQGAALREQREQVTRRYHTALRASGELPAPVDLTPLRNAVALLHTARAAAEEDDASADANLRAIELDAARLDGQLAELGDPAGEITRITWEDTTITTAVSDWTLLERALGPMGVQSLEIEAAGPGVTTIANDLLASSGMAFFALAIETAVDKRDGKGQKDVFDVRILDGRAADVVRKKGSGGEMVVVEEALRLALAIYNARRSDKVLQTLWRDETASALDPESADQYVAMLRRARDIGGFHRVLFVSHQEHVWEQADARVWFRSGGELEIA